MNLNEQQIREFAYQIWESEGRPHGQEQRHWEMACKLAREQANDDDHAEPNTIKPLEPLEQIEPPEEDEQGEKNPFNKNIDSSAEKPARKSRAKSKAEPQMAAAASKPVSKSRGTKLNGKAKSESPQVSA